MAWSITVTETLRIAELFYSIQGESTWAGLPCLFIRLAGCNLRCAYCDAAYTWQEPGTLMSLADIVAWTEQYPAEIMVEITGGEPLQQDGIYPLMQSLVDAGRTVLLETNGSLPLCGVPDAVIIIMDVKCPGSGMASHNLPDNIGLLRERSRRTCRDEIKFVLSSEDDFLWAKALVERERLHQFAPILFSPVPSLFDPRRLAELILAHGLQVRLQLQLHTLVWPGQDRGV